MTIPSVTVPYFLRLSNSLICKVMDFLKISLHLSPRDLHESFEKGITIILNDELRMTFQF